MRLLACRDTAVYKSARSNLGGASKHSFQSPTYSSHEYVGVAKKLRLAQAWGQCVDCDIELGDGVVSGDVADGEDFEELADVVSIVHASLLGVVEGVEDVGGLSLRELQVVSRKFIKTLIFQ